MLKMNFNLQHLKKRKIDQRQHINTTMNTQTYKRTKLTKTKVVNNILRFYDLANKDHIDSGMNWYTNANYFAYILSQRYGYKHYQVIGVISALSPQTNWQANQRIAELFLQGDRENLHNRAQIYKAELCLDAKEDEIFGILTKDGKKTSYFYNNILDPTKNVGVCVDRHSIGTCTQETTKTKAISNNDSQMTIAQYRFFMSCFEIASNKKGILPQQMQAITWNSYRNMRGLPSEYKTN